MGLFSRKSSKPAEKAAQAEPIAAPVVAPSAHAAASSEPVINMPISVTTVSTSGRTTTPAAAPSNGDASAQAPAAPARPPVPLVHNMLVEAALERWGAHKDAQTMFNVLRQCASGVLLLDLHGSEFTDPSKPFAPGDTIRIGSQLDNAGKKLLLVFTSNEEISKFHGGAAPLSWVQPATALLKQAVTDYEGIVINPGSPTTMCIAYEAEILQGLTPTPELNEKLKRALIDKVLPWPSLLDVVAETEAVFIATSENRDESGEIVSISMPTIDGGEGKTLAAVFTSPAEVWAWAPGINARATAIGNVARAALKDGHAGVVLNPAGQGVLLNAPDLQRLS